MINLLSYFYVQKRKLFQKDWMHFGSRKFVIRNSLNKLDLLTPQLVSGPLLYSLLPFSMLYCNVMYCIQSHAASNFYGTKIKICAGFWLVGSTEKTFATSERVSF